MMIKPEPENKLEESAVEEYLPVQNIMFHSAKINALFGPIFKELFLERFTNILRPNILCMLKKNPKDMERHINTYMASIKTITTCVVIFLYRAKEGNC